MSGEEISNFDYIIIGGAINTYLLAALLTKGNYNVLLFEKNGSIEKQIIDQFSYVPLSFFRSHSIPYSEQGIKNKSFDAYIERFIKVEKYFLPKIKTKSQVDWMFINNKQLGIINKNNFLRFIKSLLKKQKNFQTISIDESFSIQKSKNEKQTFQINFSTKTITHPINRVILTDELAETFFDEIQIERGNEEFKYEFKVIGVHTDSINHYFFKEKDEIEFLTLIPCSNFSIIEYVSKNNSENTISSFILEFLDQKYDIAEEDLIFIRKQTNYKTIDFSNPSSIIIIPESRIYSFPFNINFFTSLKSVFYLTLCLEETNLNSYMQWVELTLKSYLMLNDLLFGEDKDIHLNRLGKIIHNKDINYINFISRLIVRFRFNMAFKQIGLSTNELKMIFQLLTHSIDYKNNYNKNT